jgi:hypothetical protein
MAEIIKSSDTTTPEDEGFLVYHDVRRGDGQAVMVVAHCTRDAEDRARAVANREALVYISDRGATAALAAAEEAEIPAGSETVIVHLSIDPDTGALRTDEGGHLGSAQGQPW